MAEPRRLKQMPIETCKRIAKIMGPHSACALAFEDYSRRQAAGERVGIFRHGHSILVGPTRLLNPPPAR